jgi:predicted nucleotidyltransferase
MKQRIIDALSDAGQHLGASIIYAAESGSRAWGFSSDDSDYDVRFIYARPPKWYLSIVDGDDTFSGGNEDDDIDLHGWDLRKALVLMRKSNGNLYEWLRSPIVYYSYEPIMGDFRKLAENSLQLAPLYYHYRSMARKQYYRYILNKEEVPYKKYLYVMRPLLASIWVLDEKELPPVNFLELLAKVRIPQVTREKVGWLIAIKQEHKEHDMTTRLSKLDEFIGSRFGKMNPTPPILGPTKAAPVADFDAMFLYTLKTLYGLPYD